MCAVQIVPMMSIKVIAIINHPEPMPAKAAGKPNRSSRALALRRWRETDQIQLHAHITAHSSNFAPSLTNHNNTTTHFIHDIRLEFPLAN